ncbi:MAG: chemotaxis protein CheB, partial [Polyangiales bacterium]
AVGILLTGMGEDGAEGLLHMRQCGARTVAQDEASSVVYGMPKAAVDRDAAEHVLPLEQVASALLHLSTSHHTHPSVNDGRRTHACPGG